MIQDIDKSAKGGLGDVNRETPNWCRLKWRLTCGLVPL